MCRNISGFPKFRDPLGGFWLGVEGLVFGGPYNKDSSFLGLCWGLPVFGNYDI